MRSPVKYTFFLIISIIVLFGCKKRDPNNTEQIIISSVPDEKIVEMWIKQDNLTALISFYRTSTLRLQQLSNGDSHREASKWNAIRGIIIWRVFGSKSIPLIKNLNSFADINTSPSVTSYVSDYTTDELRNIIAVLPAGWIFKIVDDNFNEYVSHNMINEENLCIILSEYCRHKNLSLSASEFILLKVLRKYNVEHNKKKLADYLELLANKYHNLLEKYPDIIRLVEEYSKCSSYYYSYEDLCEKQQRLKDELIMARRELKSYMIKIEGYDRLTSEEIDYGNRLAQNVKEKGEELKFLKVEFDRYVKANTKAMQLEMLITQYIKRYGNWLS